MFKVKHVTNKFNYNEFQLHIKNAYKFLFLLSSQNSQKYGEYTAIII